MFCRGKVLNLGTFSTPQEAAAAYNRASKQLKGQRSSKQQEEAAQKQGKKYSSDYTGDGPWAQQKLSFSPKLQVRPLPRYGSFRSK